MQSLTRQEAERLFEQMEVVSSRLEANAEELRIRLMFSNHKTLVLGYRLKTHDRYYGSAEGGQQAAAGLEIKTNEPMDRLLT